MDSPARKTEQWRISEGTQGVKETLAVMRRIVRGDDGRANRTVIETGRAIVRHVPAKNWFGQVEAVYNFVRSNVVYVMDPVDVEALSTPVELMRIRAGDCDDMAVLLASLLTAIGHPTRFVAIGFTPGDLSHVYVETKIGERWIALDPTEPLPAGQLAWTADEVENSFIVNN